MNDPQPEEGWLVPVRWRKLEVPVQPKALIDQTIVPRNALRRRKARSVSNTIRNGTFLPVAENRGLACSLLLNTAMLAVSREMENGQDESFFNVS